MTRGQLLPLALLTMVIGCLCWTGDTFRTPDTPDCMEYCGSLFDMLSPGGFYAAIAVSVVGAVGGYLYYRRWFWWLLPAATAALVFVRWN